VRLEVLLSFVSLHFLDLKYVNRTLLFRLRLLNTCTDCSEYTFVKYIKNKAGRALDRIGSARHGTARLGSGERPRTASEPIGPRDLVLFHDTVEHDGESIIYANYNLIVTRTRYYC
jgi:hypothetical protein